MFGLLYARQSCTNQPPGSDAVAVLLALARPTTEWHQHIQSRRFNPCIAAQISRGLTGMGRLRCRVGAGGVLFVSGYAGRSRCLCGFGPGPVPDIGKAPWGVCSEGLPVRVVRRRATLPHPVECSTIAVPGLSFRVRNGTGRLTWAMTAANLLLYGQTPRSAGLVAAWEPDRGRDALIRLVFIPCSLPYGMVCRRMMRSPNGSGNECCLSSVSTGRLHPSRGFHVRPIDHVFCMGTTAARGCTECLSWSRLPA